MPTQLAQTRRAVVLPNHSNVAGGGVSSETAPAGARQGVGPVTACAAPANAVTAPVESPGLACAAPARYAADAIETTECETFVALPCEAGDEDACALRVARAAGDSCRGAIVPRSLQLMSRPGGVLVARERPLLPGLVLVSVPEEGADLVLGRLAAIPATTRMAPFATVLTPAQASLLRCLMGEGGVVGISRGCIERGVLRVSEGPLAGLERLVRRVNRHKRLAWVDLAPDDPDALGLASTMGQLAVGLEVVGKS